MLYLFSIFHISTGVFKIFKSVLYIFKCFIVQIRYLNKLKIVTQSFQYLLPILPQVNYPKNISNYFQIVNILYFKNFNKNMSY